MNKSVYAVISALALGFASQSVLGAVILVCGNTEVKWQTNSPRFRASSVSFPAGHAFTNALSNSVALWNANASNFRFNLTLNDTNINRDNGQSEIWFSDDQDVLRGAPAVTWPWYEDCHKIVEKDIAFDVSVNWTPGTFKGAMMSYAGASRPFQATALHELGHGLGLQHENVVYNVMGMDWNVLSTNGTTARAYPGADATFGATALYGVNAAGGNDVSVVHWKLTGVTGESGEYSAHGRTEIFQPSGALASRVTVNGEPRFDVPNGGSFSAELTYENNGAHDIGWFPVTFVLSSNDTIETTDRFVASRSMNFMDRGRVATTTEMIWLPNDLVHGQTYYLGVLADYLGGYEAITESNEANNATYIAIRVVESRPTSVVLAPSTVERGQTSTGRVVLDGAAPPGGVSVTIGSSNLNAASVPPTVNVIEGAYISQPFTIATGGGLCHTDYANISAFRGGGFAWSTLTVVPPEGEVEACIHKFEWEKFREGWPMVCLAVDPGFGGDPGRAGTPIGRCPPPPSCPECVYGLAGNVVKVPPSLTTLYSSLFKLTLGPTRSDAQRTISEARKVLGHAPLGSAFTKPLRERVLLNLEGSQEPATWRAARGALMEALNALEIDQRTPALVSTRLRERELTVATFGGVLVATARDVAKAGDLSLVVRSGLPALMRGYEPVWPVLAYELKFTGQLDDKGAIDVALNLRGLELRASPSSVRVLQWTGSTYRDVTTYVDTNGMYAHAKVRNLNTSLVVMQSSQVTIAKDAAGSSPK